MGATLIWLVAADLTVLVVVTAALIGSLRRARLQLVDKTLFSRGLLRTRAIAISEQSSVAEITVDLGLSTSRRLHLWMIINDADHAQLVLNRAAWDEQQLTQLREQTGIRLEVEHNVIKAREARRRWPGAVPWWGAHILLTCTPAAVLMIAIITVIQ